MKKLKKELQILMTDFFPSHERQKHFFFYTNVAANLILKVGRGTKYANASIFPLHLRGDVTFSAFFFPLLRGHKSLALFKKYIHNE